VSTEAGKTLRTLAIAILAGLCSALATAGSSRLVDVVNPFLGAFFGATVTGLVWIRCKQRSLGLTIRLISASVVGYFAAIWLPNLLVSPLRQVLRLGASGNPYSPEMFTAAGFLGALVMTLALLLIFSESKGPRVLLKCGAWSCVGALLGLLSSLLNQPAGKMVWAIVAGGGSYNEGFVDLLPFLSAYLIWQTGMAVVITLMLPQAQSVEARAGQSSLARISPANLSIAGKIFFFCIFSTVGILAFAEAHDWYEMRQFQKTSHTSQQK